MLGFDAFALAALQADMVLGGYLVPPPSSATPSTFGSTGRSRARMRSFVGFWTSCWVQPSSSSWRSRESPACPDPSRGVTRKTVPTLIVVHNA
jgi:hypothetical protein